MTGKSALRQAIRRQRAALDPLTAAAETAVSVALAWEILHRFATDHLASYVAIGSELALSSLHERWWALGRPVWLPRVVDGSTLTWHPVRSEAELMPGSFGIQEPDPARVPARALPIGTLILVPGVGFTATGDRLGQGKGYYDRVLAGPDLGPAIGVCYSCQLVPELPVEVHDRRLAGVIAGGRWLPSGVIPNDAIER